MKTEALRLALEALEDNQHLVADNERHVYVMEYNSIIEKCKEALAQPEQEPVAWADHGVVNWIADKQFKHASLLYTTPPQRTWVGLTDEEIAKEFYKFEAAGAWYQFARAIDAHVADFDRCTVQ